MLWAAVWAFPGSRSVRLPESLSSSLPFHPLDNSFCRGSKFLLLKAECLLSVSPVWRVFSDAFCEVVRTFVFNSNLDIITSASYTGLNAALSRYAAFSSLLFVPSCLYCGRQQSNALLGFLCWGLLARAGKASDFLPGRCGCSKTPSGEVCSDIELWANPSWQLSLTQPLTTVGEIGREKWGNVGCGRGSWPDKGKAALLSKEFVHCVLWAGGCSGISRNSGLRHM